ncbi:MAG: Hint domain-containing protein [Rhodobacter sp.]|nr:Hint domain-containing protein [Rhodobacter sp.]
MPVTNYTFNFTGTDIASPTDAALAVNFGGAGGTQAYTENGIQFTFSMQAGGVASNLSTPHAGGTSGMSVTEGTVTFDLVGGLSDDFFSNVVFNFGPSVGGSHSIKLIRSKTTGGANLGANVTTTITSGAIAGGGSAAAPAGIWNKIVFTATGTGGNDFITLNSITATINCFLEGTVIGTVDGGQPVELLQPGDRLVTADGRETTVKWVARQAIDPRLTHPAKVNPICIRAGALGEGVPQRDLYVTADHAVELHGVLYNAGALVNGRSIYRVPNMPLEKPITYYHIETDAHELLLAEGCPAESYIDYATRDAFDNADEATEADVIAEMDLPRVSAARMVPEDVKSWLDDRAEAIGRRAA